MGICRPECLGAPELLATVFDEVVAAGYERPILAGGAAVEFYRGGAVVWGAPLSFETDAAQSDGQAGGNRRASLMGVRSFTI
jgi:hypothetical protein